MKLLAAAGMIDPARKKARLMYIKALRPKTCENDPMIGWNTVDVRRNEVPDQNASMAEPLSAFAMIGRATEIDVASRAAMRVMTQRLMKAAMNRHPGWNFSGAGDCDVSEVVSLCG